VTARTLVADNVTVRYGGVIALEGASLRVEPGAIVGLIGPNGAGKTTLINAITGVVRPSSGTIALGPSRLDRLPAHRVARAGIARTYQNVRLFARLDVADNVRAGAFARRGTLSDTEIVTLLERTGTLERDLHRRAGALPYGEQRRLEVARIGQAVGTDRAQLRETKKWPVILADITRGLAIRQQTPERDTSRNDGDLARRDLDAAKFGQQVQPAALRDEQQFAVPVDKDPRCHVEVGHIDVDGHAVQRRRVVARHHRRHRIDQVDRRGRLTGRVPTQAIGGERRLRHAWGE